MNHSYSKLAIRKIEESFEYAGSFIPGIFFGGIKWNDLSKCVTSFRADLVQSDKHGITRMATSTR